MTQEILEKKRQNLRALSNEQSERPWNAVLNVDVPARPAGQCPECGAELIEVRVGDKWVKGACLTCLAAERNAEWISRVREENSRRALHNTATLEEFVTDEEYQRVGYEATMEFLRTVEKGVPRALVLASWSTEDWSGFGTGKTHLASGLAAKLAVRGWDVRSWVVPDLLSEIRASYDGEEDTEYNILRIARSADLVVLDELGLESYQSEEWHHEKMYRLLNARYLHGPLVVTTNLSPSELSEHLGGAGFSRLWAMTDQGKRVVDMCGPDYRFL